MEVLACPVCKGELELEITREEDEEIVEGALKCAQCAESYPISNAIPNLLPPSMRT